MADSLPLETLQEIFSYQAGHLASCACVCRQWQVAAERFTFADLHISSADLEDFRQIFPISNSAGRRFHLRSLHFKIVIPKYSIAARCKYEEQDDRYSNNNAFTQAITSLFKILSSWPEYGRYMSLQIYARSPSSDWQAEPDWTTRRARLERGRAFPEEELVQRRYQDSYLQLMGEIALSDVKCITSLDVMGCENFRNMAPGAVSEMVVHLPRLQTVTATLRDKVRNGSLGDFPSVAARWPSSLRHLQLRYEPRQGYGEDYSPHSTPGPTSRSLALCQMMQQLESVDLSETTIGPDLFWPVGANDITPSWPNLTKFTIIYSNDFVSRDRPADLTDEDLRTSLKSKDLDELSLAAGRAAQHMPRLQSMEINLSLTSMPTAHYYFIYIATVGKATWAVTSQFYVSKKAQQAWDVAAKRHGNALPSVEVCDMDTYSSDSRTICSTEACQQHHSARADLNELTTRYTNAPIYRSSPFHGDLGFEEASISEFYVSKEAQEAWDGAAKRNGDEPAACPSIPGWTYIQGQRYLSFCARYYNACFDPVAIWCGFCACISHPWEFVLWTLILRAVEDFAGLRMLPAPS